MAAQNTFANYNAVSEVDAGSEANFTNSHRSTSSNYAVRVLAVFFSSLSHFVIWFKTFWFSFLLSTPSTTTALPSYASSIQPHITNSVTTNSKLQNNTPPTTPPVLNSIPPDIAPKMSQKTPPVRLNVMQSALLWTTVNICSYISNHSLQINAHQPSPANNIVPVSEPPSYASTMAFKAASTMAAKNHMGKLERNYESLSSACTFQNVFFKYTEFFVHKITPLSSSYS